MMNDGFLKRLRARCSYILWRFRMLWSVCPDRVVNKLIPVLWSLGGVLLLASLLYVLPVGDMALWLSKVLIAAVLAVIAFVILLIAGGGLNKFLKSPSFKAWRQPSKKEQGGQEARGGGSTTKNKPLGIARWSFLGLLVTVLVLAVVPLSRDWSAVLTALIAVPILIIIYTHRKRGERFEHFLSFVAVTLIVWTILGLYVPALKTLGEKSLGWANDGVVSLTTYIEEGADPNALAMNAKTRPSLLCEKQAFQEPIPAGIALFKVPLMDYCFQKVVIPWDWPGFDKKLGVGHYYWTSGMRRPEYLEPDRHYHRPKQVFYVAGTGTLTYFRLGR